MKNRHLHMVLLMVATFALMTVGVAKATTEVPIQEEEEGKEEKIPKKSSDEKPAKEEIFSTSVTGDTEIEQPGYYEQKRYFDSDVHIYISGTKDKLGVTIGSPKFEKLSAMRTENEIAKINMGMFNPQTGTQHGGTWLVDGKYMQQPSGRYIDLHYYKDGHIDIKNYNESISQETIAELREETVFVVGTTYSLVQDGMKNLENAEAFTHSTQRNPRSMFGQLRDGRYAIVVVDGRSKSSLGVTADQSAEIMLALGAVEAVNFDGGGSSAMVVRGKLLNKPSEGSERAIGSALVFIK